MSLDVTLKPIAVVVRQATQWPAKFVATGLIVLAPVVLIPYL
jgi:hypothetical protein